MTEQAVRSDEFVLSHAGASPSALGARFSAAAAIITVAVGVGLLGGWALAPDAMRRALAADTVMPPITAVGFAAAGAALWLERRPRTRRAPLRIVSLVLAVLVVALGALSFTERVWNVDLGIDRLLLPDGRAGRYHMATNTAVGFVLAGAALLVLDAPRQRWGRTAQWLATGGLLIASAAIVGYLYGVQALYQVDTAAAMALSTALSFFALHAGLLFSRAEDAWPGVLVARDAGGSLARRLLVAVAAVPLALGWLLIYLSKGSLASGEAGVALLVVALTAVLMLVVIRAANEVRGSAAAVHAILQREADARQQAERANNAKNDFLAVMSHELRTPLNAIIGYSSLMAEGIPDTATTAQRRQLDRIHASATHLLTLIEQVLTLSRMELREQVSFGPVRVAELAEDSAAMVAPQAREKQIDLTVVVDDDALVIDTDEAKLRQALVNLMGNAVKFTHRGYVRLHVERPADEDRIRFTVEDSGPGIPPEHLERIFEAFWQLDQSASRRAGGVGLGLHVTRGIVRSLGGDITVRSTPAQGSAFTIRLPVQR